MKRYLSSPKENLFQPETPYPDMLLLKRDRGIIKSILRHEKIQNIVFPAPFLRPSIRIPHGSLCIHAAASLRPDFSSSFLLRSLPFGASLHEHTLSGPLGNPSPTHSARPSASPASFETLGHTYQQRAGYLLALLSL